MDAMRCMCWKVKTVKSAFIELESVHDSLSLLVASKCALWFSVTWKKMQFSSEDSISFEAGNGFNSLQLDRIQDATEDTLRFASHNTATITQKANEC